MLEAVAKYAFEIGLKPLSYAKINTLLAIKSIYLLLLAEAVFVVEKFETVKDMLHGNQWVRKVLYPEIRSDMMFRSFGF